MIVRSLEKIIDRTGRLPGNIAIFGEGNLRDILFQSFGATPFFEDCSHLKEAEIFEKIELLDTPETGGMKKIYFFGWQSHATIRNILQISHFSLMPSRFLETFGLSALESLAE